MTYRDDRDADQARITALESELAAAQRKIGELEGHREQALVLASRGTLATTGDDRTRSTAEIWLGAPLRLELAHTFDTAFPPERFEDLIPMIREITHDTGRSEVLRSSFTWTSSSSPTNVGPFLVVTVAVKDGRTTLSVTDRLGQLAGALYGGFAGGLGGGAIVGPVLASIAVPVLAPVFIAGWLGGVYGATRWLYRRSARKRAERVQLVFDALVAELETILNPKEP